MATSLPCPNPTCSHQFDTATVQTSANLRCPKCGFQLKGFGSDEPAKPIPAKPIVAPPAKPVNESPWWASEQSPAKPNPPPMAKPIPPAIPKPVVAPPAAKLIKPDQVPAPPISAKPIGKLALDDFDVELVELNSLRPANSSAIPTPSSAPSDFNLGGKTGPLIQASALRVRRGGRKMWITLGAFLLSLGLVLGIGYYIIFVAFNFGKSFGFSGRDDTTGIVGAIRNSKNVDEKVFKLVLPSGNWSINKTERAQLAARQDYDKEAWFAEAWNSAERDLGLGIIVRDFGMQKATNSELIRIAKEKLEQVYGDTLELDNKVEPAKFAGVSGQRWLYKGKLSWWGECIMFTQNGFGYWIFVASPEKDDIQKLIGDLQNEGQGFSLLNDRRGWREQKLPSEFFANETKTLSFEFPQGKWNKHDAKTLDPKGEIYLLGRFKQEINNRKNGHVLVLARDPQADLKLALNMARDQLKAEFQRPDYELVLLQAGSDAEEKNTKDDAIGYLETLGNRRARVAEFKLGKDVKDSKYYLLAVVNEEAVCYVIQCECPWESKEIWRQDFIELLHSLRVQK